MFRLVAAILLLHDSMHLNSRVVRKVFDADVYIPQKLVVPYIINQLNTINTIWHQREHRSSKGMGKLIAHNSKLHICLPAHAQ